MATTIFLTLVLDDLTVIDDLQKSLPDFEYEVVSGLDGAAFITISIGSAALAIQFISLIVQIKQTKKSKVAINEISISKDGRKKRIVTKNLTEAAQIALIQSETGSETDSNQPHQP